MLQLVLHLNDERLFVVDAEGSDAQTIATIGAAQTDEHRRGLWTLKEGKHVLQPSQPIAAYFKHGDHAALHLFEAGARETPAGSTHPDDQEPVETRLRRLADDVAREREQCLRDATPLPTARSSHATPQQARKRRSRRR